MSLWDSRSRYDINLETGNMDHFMGTVIMRESFTINDSLMYLFIYPLMTLLFYTVIYILSKQV